MIGKTLGPYKILEPLGAGGMGEVYLGEDTRLGRKVAIKVLPAEFASDPERLARFEQEARAAAALNHPHIAAVFDVGSAPVAVDGDDEGNSGSRDSEPGKSTAVTHYMVQEYLEGETLGDALRTGRLPLKKALDLATEVAEALAAAHGAGIIHRDLKPANIFITKDNHAKVLDFGLAKLTEMATIGAPDGASKSPTLLGTVAGQVMGTAGYMAPEQVEATAEIDKRADIFAFGCVLYESVTGSQAFSGTSVLDTLHRIAHSQPRELAEIDDGLPAEAQRIIGKCLAKEPSARYQHADDLIVDLKGLATQVETGTAVTIGAAGVAPGTEAGIGAGDAAAAMPGSAGTAAGGLSWRIAVPVVIVSAALAGFAGWMFRPPVAEPLVRRFEIPFPPETTVQFGATLGVAISPDGEHIAFNADSQLWMRNIGDLFAEPIRGTEGARNPFFSPDGQELGFWSQDQIKKVSVTGGAPIPLGASPGRPHGISWGADGFIYAANVPGNTIYRLPENGGEAQLLVDANDTGMLSAPTLLPGEEWLMFSVAEGGRWGEASIVAENLATGDRKTLLRGGSGARYVPSGHLVYTLGDSILAIAYDEANVETIGGPVAMEGGVAATGLGGLGNFAFSHRGGLVFRPGSGSGVNFSLVRADREGNVEPLPFPAGNYFALDLAPDDNRIAVAVVDETPAVWIYEIEGGTSIPLSDEGGTSPTWSPDGEWVYYGHNRSGMWRRRADRSLPPEQLTESRQDPSAVSPDGGTILLTQFDEGSPASVATFPVESPEEIAVVVGTSAGERTADFSPDGRFITYMSDESGQNRVYVQELETGRQWPVSAGLAFVPIWSPNGDEIFYTGPGSMNVAQVETDPEFRVVDTRVLFTNTRMRGFTLFDVTSDAQSFIYVHSGTDAGDSAIAGPSLHVVLDWFEELKERVPGR